MCSIWVSFFIANLTYLVASSKVAVIACYLNVHMVSYLCKCFVCPNGFTNFAIPVFNVTVPCLAISTSFCFNVNELVFSNRSNNAILVSYLCKCFIKPCIATNFAIPVFYVTGIHTCSCYCVYVYDCMCSVWIAFFTTNLTYLVASIEVAVTKSIAIC